MHLRNLWPSRLHGNLVSWQFLATGSAEWRLVPVQIVQDPYEFTREPDPACDGAEAVTSTPFSSGIRLSAAEVVVLDGTNLLSCYHYNGHTMGVRCASS